MRMMEMETENAARVSFFLLEGGVKGIQVVLLRLSR